MPIPFSLFLALKYLRPKRSFISVVTVISVIGVVLGVAILVIVLSVMTGFDNMWRDKILSFKPHLTVYGSMGLVTEEEELSDRIESLAGFEGAAPVIHILTLIQNHDRFDAPFVLGITPERAERVTGVGSSITQGTFNISGNHVVIGVDLARTLNLRLGDTCLLYSPMNVMSEDEIHLPEEAVVAGIFDMGMSAYDSRFVLTSLDMARDLSGVEEGAQLIYVMTDDAFRFAERAEDLRLELGQGYDVRTWKEEDSLLFAALRNEKTIMFALLVFISIVAVFCVANTLIVITVQKTHEIGLLKALGYSSAKIMGVFVWHGWIQGVVGTLFGIGLGILVVENLNSIVQWLTHWNVEIFPKGIYGISELPAETNWRDVIAIAIVVNVLCTLASVLSSYRAAALNPADALRHE
ncbi:MAG: ABC transporter permease [Verrucomicrobia bacterium]|nr:ABC transporter permease [Verrucomicrobiota bacterium]MDA1086106.1 ABC transporter permease [Verrucomicrobiota bacterium]